MIETDRLILRKFTLDDTEAAYNMNKDPLVQEHIVAEGNPTLEDIRNLIKNNILGDYEKHGFGRLAVIHKADNKFIVFTGLKYVDELDEVDVGFRFDSNYWGRGFAFESTKATMDYGFEKLGLNRIVAAALPENKGSIKLMERLGMKFEKFITIDGYKMVYYAINNPAPNDAD